MEKTQEKSQDVHGQRRRKVQGQQTPPTLSTYSVQTLINGRWEQDPLSPMKDTSRSELVRHYGGHTGGPHSGTIRVRIFSTP